MAVNIKFLFDNDLPASLYDAFRERKLRVDFSRNRVENEGRAEDVDILLWACEHNWHIVTHDQSYLNPDTHPCNNRRYARRTVLSLPAYLLHQADKYLFAAWHLTTWAGLKEHDAIEIQQDTVIAYRCGGRTYVEVKRWPLHV